MPVRNIRQNLLKVMVDRRHASDQLLKKEDQDPRHCSTIITPQFLMPERGLVQPGQCNQVTGNTVSQDLDGRGCRFSALLNRECPATSPAAFCIRIAGPALWLIPR